MAEMRQWSLLDENSTLEEEGRGPSMLGPSERFLVASVDGIANRDHDT